MVGSWLRELGRGEGDVKFPRGREAHRDRARPTHGLDQAGRPDEVLGEHQYGARRAGISGQLTVQVSPENSSLDRSPLPLFAMASSICAVTSWSCVGCDVRRRMPTGTGKSG